MKTLQIEIPKGFIIKSVDKESGTVSFEPKPKGIMSKIKTFDDVLMHLGIDKEDFGHRIEDMSPDEAAYIKIKHIAQTLNEGWVPNWDDSSQYKYFPWFKMGSSGFRYYDFDLWRTISFVGSRLCFKSAELADYAATQFEDIYKDFLTLN